MKLYYTTSAGTDKEQKKTVNSVGGYKSSTRVPNSQLNNLFGDISTYTYQNDKTHYIALFLNNDTGSDVSDVELYFSYPENCYTKLEIGAVTPTQDADGEYYIERLNDYDSAPYSVIFYEANGESNKVNLGDITNGSSLGLFVKRTLSKDVIDDDYDNLVEKDGDTYSQKQLDQQDSIDIVISWT